MILELAPAVLIVHDERMGGVASYFTKLKPKLTTRADSFIVGRRNGERRGTSRFFRLLRDYAAFAKALRSKRYDIVQLNPPFEFKAFGREAGFSLLARLCRVRTIVFWRGADASFTSRFERWPFAGMFRSLFGHAAAFVVLSQFEVDMLRRWGCRQPICREVTVADDDALVGFDVHRAIERRLAAPEWRILFAGRVVRPKGIFEAIQAVGSLRTGKPVRLLVAGDGADLPEARRFASDYGIPNVTFMGPLCAEDMGALIASAHITLLPTQHFEGLSNIVVESMAFGLPIVTRPVGGIVDFFRNGVHGFMTSATRPEAFAALVTTLCEDRNLYRDIALTNFQYARTHFLASQAAARLEALYAAVRNDCAGRNLPTPEVHLA